MEAVKLKLEKNNGSSEVKARKPNELWHSSNGGGEGRGGTNGRRMPPNTETSKTTLKTPIQ